MPLSSSGSANIPDDSRSIRKLYYYNVPPQAAVLPGRDSTGHNSFCSPVLQGSSFSQGALYFSLMIWVNGSVLLTDGSLLGVPAKAVSESPRLGARGWGIRQGKCHLVRSLGDSQQPPLSTTPAASRGIFGWPVSIQEPHLQPHRPGLFPAVTFWQLLPDLGMERNRKKRK